MITFIYTLLGSVIASIAFLTYKHPTHGKKITSIGISICIAILFLASTFEAGYKVGATQYFKLDENSKNLDKVINIISDVITTIKIIATIVGLCLLVLYILSMTTFKEIHGNIDKTENKKAD
jgi:TRAP-type C4-dicarboxylate transport system permease small subunit